MISNWTEQKINTVSDYNTGDTVTAEAFNAAINLLITQGNYTADEMAVIVPVIQEIQTVLASGTELYAKFDDIATIVEYVDTKIDSKTQIEDNMSSGATTYSSNKIEALFTAINTLITEHASLNTIDKNSLLANIDEVNTNLDTTNSNVALKADKTITNGIQNQINTITTQSDNYYVKCLQTDVGALLVVSSGATTGQINLASVTPHMSDYTPIAGDYVTETYNTLNAETKGLRTAVDGTVYPTAREAVVGQIIDIKGDLSEVYNELNLTYITKYYISSNGIIYANDDFKYSLPFYVKGGTKLKIKVKGYLTNVAILSETDQTGTAYKPKVISTDSAFKWYEYSVYIDGYYCICSHAIVVPTVLADTDELINNDVSDIKESTCEYVPSYESIGTLTNSKNMQINESGYSYIANADASYNLITIDVINETRLRVYCSSGSSVQWNVGYCCVAANNSVLVQYNTPSYQNGYVEFDIPDGTAHVYVNGIGGVIPKAEKITKKLAAKIIDEYCDLSLFTNFGVVGDSFASGEMFYNSAYTDNYEISWGQILARKKGTICTNYSQGGLHTRSWLTAPYGLPLLLSKEAEQIYYLAPGINDYYSLGESYLGSITDITGHTGYANYGDTFYGNYGRIIEQILAHAPNAKIVMFTIAVTSGLGQKFNDAIINIANHYELPYIVQTDDPFFLSTTYTNMSGGHPRAIAYSGMACAFERLLNKCIINNYDYFKDCFMY